MFQQAKIHEKLEEAISKSEQPLNFLFDAPLKLKFDSMEPSPKNCNEEDTAILIFHHTNYCYFLKSEYCRIMNFLISTN